MCDLLGGFDEGVSRHDHEDAVGENGDDDKEGEEWVDENNDRHPPDGIERRQDPHGVGGAKPVNVFAFADHHKRLTDTQQQEKSNYIFILRSKTWSIVFN